MAKSKINRRLLKYNLKTFNYNKINNKAYFKRYFGRLLANYFLNEYNTQSFVKTLRKYSGPNFFSILKSDFKEVQEKLKEEFGLNFENINDRSRLFTIFENKRCPECATQVFGKYTFCSPKCANSFKAKDKSFLETLSNSVKKYHSSLTIEEKEELNSKISNGVTIFNTLLTPEIRKEKYTNSVLRYSAFDTFCQNFNFTVLCTSEYFYNNRYIPVRCKTCSFEWNVTKSTSYARTECRCCTPYLRGTKEFKDRIAISKTQSYNKRRNLEGTDYSGIVYILHFPHLEAIKIGLTSNFNSRSKDLIKDFGEFNIIQLIETKSCYALESELHEKFAKYRIVFEEGGGRTEFFRETILDISL